jgi:hypothetical protein
MSAECRVLGGKLRRKTSVRSVFLAEKHDSNVKTRPQVGVESAGEVAEIGVCGSRHSRCVAKQNDGCASWIWSWHCEIYL